MALRRRLFPRQQDSSGGTVLWVSPGPRNTDAGPRCLRTIAVGRSSPSRPSITLASSVQPRQPRHVLSPGALHLFVIAGAGTFRRESRPFPAGVRRIRAAALLSSAYTGYARIANSDRGSTRAARLIPKPSCDHPALLFARCLVACAVRRRDRVLGGATARAALAFPYPSVGAHRLDWRRHGDAGRDPSQLLASHACVRDGASRRPALAWRRSSRPRSRRACSSSGPCQPSCRHSALRSVIPASFTILVYYGIANRPPAMPRLASCMHQCPCRLFCAFCAVLGFS